MKNKFLYFLSIIYINIYCIISKSIINCEIANINGNPILISDIYEINNFLEQSNSQKMDKVDILDKLITNKILKEYCEKNFNKNEIKMQLEMQMKLVKKAIEDHTLKILNDYFQNDREAFFRESGLSVNDFIATNIKTQREQIYISLAMQKLINNNNLDFSPKKINEYIHNKAQKDISTHEELYEVCELVVDNIIQKEKTDLVKKIYEEILKNKDKFESIISKYSDKDINFGEIDILEEKLPFNFALLNLKNNEISEIIDTANAFYIIKYINRKGTKYEVVGLTILKDNYSNDANIVEYLKNIKSEIENKKISWIDAVLKYSTNKKNKNYAGVILNSNKTELINKDYLSTEEYNNISKMKEGEISEPIKSFNFNGETVFKLLLLKKKYPITTDKREYDFSQIVKQYNKEITTKKIQNIKKNILKNSKIVLDEEFEICKQWNEKYNNNKL